MALFLGRTYWVFLVLGLKLLVCLGRKTHLTGNAVMKVWHIVNPLVCCLSKMRECVLNHSFAIYVMTKKATESKLFIALWLPIRMNSTESLGNENNVSWHVRRQGQLSEYSKKCVQEKINRTRSQVRELGHVYSSCLAVSVLSRLCFLRVNQKCLEQCEKQNVQGTIPRRQTGYSHLLFVGKLCRRRRL